MQILIVKKKTLNNSQRLSKEIQLLEYYLEIIRLM